MSAGTYLLSMPAMQLPSHCLGFKGLHAQKCTDTKKATLGPGEMAQWLGTLAVAENPGPFPRTYMVAHNHLLSLQFQGI